METPTLIICASALIAINDIAKNKKPEKIVFFIILLLS
jgi:hypothetical protein